jgi:hypothetical protein
VCWTWIDRPLNPTVAELVKHGTTLFARNVLPRLRELWRHHENRWWPMGQPETGS